MGSDQMAAHEDQRRTQGEHRTFVGTDAEQDDEFIRGEVTQVNHLDLFRLGGIRKFDVQSERCIFKPVRCRSSNEPDCRGQEGSFGSRSQTSSRSDEVSKYARAGAEAPLSLTTIAS